MEEEEKNSSAFDYLMNLHIGANFPPVQDNAVDPVSVEKPKQSVCLKKTNKCVVNCEECLANLPLLNFIRLWITGT